MKTFLTSLSSAALVIVVVGQSPANAAEAVTCRSDRITYVPDDGRREFVVTETRRGTQAVPHAGGTLTKEVQVFNGRVGEKTFYVYDTAGEFITLGWEPS